MNDSFNTVHPAVPKATYASSEQHQTVSKSKPSRQLPRWPKAAIALIVLVVVIVGGCMLWQYQNTKGEAKVNKNEYQAVFLTNGQVYFGKLTAANKSYLNLTDIYYLQVQTAQPSSAPTSTSVTSSSNSSSNSSGQVQLVKLGNELHGPEDQMSISHEQVLFWENLKPSGKVTQAIDKYQDK